MASALHEVLVRMSAGVQASEGLSRREELPSRRPMVGRRPRFLTTWASPQVLEGPRDMQLAFPQASVPREKA